LSLLILGFVIFARRTSSSSFLSGICKLGAHAVAKQWVPYEMMEIWQLLLGKSAAKRYCTNMKPFEQNLLHGTCCARVLGMRWHSKAETLGLDHPKLVFRSRVNVEKKT